MFKDREGNDTTFGSPDLALLAFAIFAIIAYFYI